MYDNITDKNEEIEVDLQRLLGALMKKAWLIGIVSVVCAVAVFLGTVFFVAPQYESTAMFYVNNNSLSLGETSLSITSSDISASKSLVNTYIVILNTRESLTDVIDYAGVDRTYAQLKGMISAEAVDSTQVFRVVVTSEDPVEAEKIADAIAYVLPKRISSIIEGTSAKVVDSAVLPASPSSPSYTKNAMIGLVLGFALMVMYVVIRELMDVTIRTEEDITRCCKPPVLTSVPDMEIHTKGEHYYGYGQRKNPTVKTGGKQTELVGGTISFAAAESYKMLRTKLQFSFADEGNCRIIGVSSALHGEGKSLTAVNLAYSMSQLGKRVLLIDCDMRRPSLAEKMPLNKEVGLSDFLTGQNSSDNLIQRCGIKGDEKAFHAIASGRVPPNPMELLSSARMEKMLTLLRDKYDYIILDLPPVGEVGDALAAAKLTDGMLLVVRQHYCNRIVLNSAARQFEFVDAKMLGIVFNCTSEEGSGYRSRYYTKYYKKYYGYQSAAKRTRRS
ncbi:MAG: polysaccharide biosynthesis tyrosine autokinase [Oscillospiraceae bacterium]|nr:polysaccharide biosynthesis tyrosine autokinase [Oscillospiraceae bacterium]